MKKLLSALLMVCLLIVPTYAEEISNQQMEDSPQTDCVVVSTLDELQAAIATANDADTIVVSQTVTIEHQELVSEKNITLIRAAGFSNCLLRLCDGSAISGFTIIDDGQKSCSVYAETHSETISISNCAFIGNNNDYSNMINIFEGNVVVSACTFQDGNETAIWISSFSNVVIENCFFEGNKSILRGGAIQNGGDLTIKNSEITKNQASLGGGIFNSGNMSISNCVIKDNASIEEPGADIFSNGKLAIGCMEDLPDNTAFYNEISGEKMLLPIDNYAAPLKLICLTDEQAIEYFATEPPQNEEENLPNPGDENGDNDTPIETPQEPDGEDKDDSTNPDNGDQDKTQPPQETTQPPQDNGDGDDLEQPPQDGIDDNPPQGTGQPAEPPQGDFTDNPATIPDTPQQPQEPPQSSNANDGDYIPPTDYRPSQRPLWPSTSTSKPTEQPDVPAQKPQLICNGAAIDASKTIVLFGYGDGQLHEADSLTRAQLATIIYRLLDAESIDLYSNTHLTFVDVTADAWYAPYVKVIQAAGIVNGVGNGKYDPNGTVTWAQILTILTRFVEMQEVELQHIQYDGWATPALKTAVALGWIEDSAAFRPDAVISRGELMQLVNSVLALYR